MKTEILAVSSTVCAALILYYIADGIACSVQAAADYKQLCEYYESTHTVSTDALQEPSYIEVTVDSKPFAANEVSAFAECEITEVPVQDIVTITEDYKTTVQPQCF